MTDAEFSAAERNWERNQELQAERDDYDDDPHYRDPIYCPGCTRRNCGECPV